MPESPNVHAARLDPALREEVLRSFSGAIAPVRIGGLYGAGLAVVAVAMVLLPAVYGLLILLVGYAVTHHAVANVHLLSTVKPVKVAAVVYIGPLFAGTVALLFMVKPLFAPRARRAAPRSLDPRQEPLVFAFVERVCQAVGAPMPRRIDVDAQVNASAGFRRGFTSLFGRDLVLTIGLPLVAGLSLQQLAGVLAHEFGHFAQATAMRLTYVIRGVNGWFARVVYARDAWDQSLEDTFRERGNLWIWIVVGLARVLVWITRRILWVLMWVGHAISCFMLRQMEYDADRYEARLVGADTFESTVRELARLNAAYQASFPELSRLWRAGRLVDSLPGLVAAARGELEPSLLAALDEGIEASRTGRLDTHPADRDRIASARREGGRAVFRSPLPATALFQDFPDLARGVSLDFYEANLGEAADPARLTPLAEVLAARTAAGREVQAGLRFFQRRPSRGHAAVLPATPPGEAISVEQLRERLRRARERLQREGTATRAVQRTYDRQRERLLRASVAKTLRAHREDISGLLAEQSQAGEQLAGLREQLEEFGRLGGERLVDALRLLASPGMADLQPELAGCAPEVARLLPIARRLGAASDVLDEIHRLAVVLEAVSDEIQAHPDEVYLPSRLDDTCAALCRQLDRLREQLDGLDYPFDHHGQLALSDYVFDARPDPSAPGPTYGLALASLGRSAEVFHRTMGRLAAIAERAEAVIGLEPLPPPAEEDEEEDEAAS